MCMIDYGDGMVSVIRDTKPVARKAHHCGECHREIQPGEQYERIDGVWEGEMETYKTCVHCQAVREWLQQVCGGWLYSAVGEDLYEHYREGYGIWLGRAYISIRNKWRRRDGALMQPMKLPDQLPTG